MRNKYINLVHEWKNLGYDGLVIAPLITDIIIKGGRSQVVKHNNVSYLWLNGNSKLYPIVIIPIKGYYFGNSLDKITYNAYDNFLEYISLLSIYNNNQVIEIYHSAFKNYFGPLESLDTWKPFISRVQPSISIENEVFDNTIKLTNNEKNALSLFRDGNSTENPFHSFLSFFKILELYFPAKRVKNKERYIDDWSELNTWINNNGAKIHNTMLRCLSGGLGDYSKFLERKKNMTSSDYLRSCLRNAIAHTSLSGHKILVQNITNDYFDVYYAKQFVKSASLFLLIESLKKL